MGIFRVPGNAKEHKANNPIKKKTWNRCFMNTPDWNVAAVSHLSNWYKIAQNCRKPINLLGKEMSVLSTNLRVDKQKYPQKQNSWSVTIQKECDWICEIKPLCKWPLTHKSHKTYVKLKTSSVWGMFPCVNHPKLNEEHLR